MTDTLVGTEIAVPESARLPVGDVDRMMALAAEKGPEGVEVLERLVELRLKLLDRDAEMAMNHALATFKDTCPPIPRDKAGKSFKNAEGVKVPIFYSDLETISRIADPVLLPLGLSYTWTIEAVDGGRILRGTFHLMHVDGARRDSTMVMPCGNDVDSYAGAQTRLKRLTMGNGLGIVTQEGGDTEEAEPVTNEQVAELMALVDQILTETEKYTVSERISRFLAFLGVDALADLPSDRFDAAKASLESLR